MSTVIEKIKNDFKKGKHSLSHSFWASRIWMCLSLVHQAQSTTGCYNQEGWDPLAGSLSGLLVGLRRSTSKLITVAIGRPQVLSGLWPEVCPDHGSRLPSEQ